VPIEHLEHANDGKQCWHTVGCGAFRGGVLQGIPLISGAGRFFPLASAKLESSSGVSIIYFQRKGILVAALQPLI
jgi:hypothetical protein